VNAPKHLAIDERVLGYLRVSTDEQVGSGLGIAAQRAAIAAEADRRGWDVQWVTDAGASGKDLNRPGIRDALAHLENGGPKVLVAAKLDRLSRSVVDFAGLLDRAHRQGWALVVLDVGLDTTTPMGRFVAITMANVAELERQMIGERTRVALAAKKAQGTRLGRPRTLPDATLDRVVAMRRKGKSYRTIAAELNSDGIPTAQGGRWVHTTVARALRSAALDAEAAAQKG